MAAATNTRVATLNEQEILADESFLDELSAVAAEAGKSRADALEYATKCLDELSVRPEEKYLDRVAKMARFMYSRSYDPVLDINHEQLDRLGELSKDHPMVFLWSHKSHMDAFVFMRAIYDSNFRPQPLSFAGINMAFAGMNALAKRSGAVFVRRSFKDDPIYKLVFKRYIDYLVAMRVPLSWSIEGTRSRTGKLMPPKMGLIQWVIESYRRASCDDALLVPVSIAFDQIAEMDDYIAMQKGKPKRKESLRWFISYVSGLKARNGKVYLRFAEPVALSDAISLPDEMFSGESEPDRIQVQKLAFEVMSRIEHATPVTINDLVTMVLLAANDRALTEHQIRVHAQEIIALIHRRGLPTAGDLSFESGADLRVALAAMVATALVDCYDGGSEPVFRITPGKQLGAAYYRNTIIHYFLSSAIAEFAIAALADEPESEEQFWDAAFSFRDLLKFEFFFRSKDEFRVDIEDYLGERYPRWKAAFADKRRAADLLFRDKPPLFCHSIMRSFIEAYEVFARVLLRRDGESVGQSDEKALTKDCLGQGKELLLRKRISSESALSEPLFATAAELGRYRGLLDGPRAELETARNEFASEIDAALVAISLLQHYYDDQQEPDAAR